MIKVRQKGRINRTFIVKNPKKIKWWKGFIKNTEGRVSFVISEILEDTDDEER